MDQSPDSQFVSNPHLKSLDDDMLFHIGIKAGDHQKLRNLFGDVKVSLLVRASFHYMQTQMSITDHDTRSDIIVLLLNLTLIVGEKLFMNICNFMQHLHITSVLVVIFFCYILS